MTGRGDVSHRVTDLQVAAMTHRPDPHTEEGAPVRARAGHPARWRCDLRHPRLLVVDDVLHDEECAALVRIASRRAAGAGPTHVSLAGPGLNAYESACRDHVDERLHALFDGPRDARWSLHVWRGAGAWPGLGHRLAGAASGAGSCAGMLVCWLHVPRRGAWLALPALGLAVAARRGTALFLGPAALAGLAGAPTSESPDAEDMTWIATQCFIEC